VLLTFNVYVAAIVLREPDLALVPTATRALPFASRKSVQMANRSQLTLHCGLNIVTRNNDCFERFVLSSILEHTPS